MSARWESQALLEPITAEQPCGESLEDTHCWRRSMRSAVRSGQADRARRPEVDTETSRRKGQTRERSAERARICGCWRPGDGVAEDGWPAGFSETLNVASQWLETLLDPDVSAGRRRCDPAAERVELLCRSDGGGRRVAAAAAGQQPAARHVQPSRHRHRDAAAAARRGRRPGRRESGQRGVRGDAARGADGAPRQRGRRPSARCSKIDAEMREAAGSEATPDLRPACRRSWQDGRRCCARSSRSHPGSREATIRRRGGTAAPAPGRLAGGPVKSRQDAIRALDAVAEFFRRTEPSSPIPLFLERAKRLVSKDFLEVLADIAPDAVAQARAAGGLKTSE